MQRKRPDQAVGGPDKIAGFNKSVGDGKSKQTVQLMVDINVCVHGRPSLHLTQGDKAPRTPFRGSRVIIAMKPPGQSRTDFVLRAVRSGAVDPHFGLTPIREGLRFDEPKQFGEGSYKLCEGLYEFYCFLHVITPFRGRYPISLTSGQLRALPVFIVSYRRMAAGGIKRPGKPKRPLRFVISASVERLGTHVSFCPPLIFRRLAPFII